MFSIDACVMQFCFCVPAYRFVRITSITIPHIPRNTPAIPNPYDLPESANTLLRVHRQQSVADGKVDFLTGRLRRTGETRWDPPPPPPPPPPHSRADAAAPVVLAAAPVDACARR